MIKKRKVSLCREGPCSLQVSGESHVRIEKHVLIQDLFELKYRTSEDSVVQVLEVRQKYVCWLLESYSYMNS